MPPTSWRSHWNGGHVGLWKGTGNSRETLENTERRNPYIIFSKGLNRLGVG